MANCPRAIGELLATLLAHRLRPHGARERAACRIARLLRAVWRTSLDAQDVVPPERGLDPVPVRSGLPGPTTPAAARSRTEVPAADVPASGNRLLACTETWLARPGSHSGAIVSCPPGGRLMEPTAFVRSVDACVSAPSCASRSDPLPLRTRQRLRVGAELRERRQRAALPGPDHRAFANGSSSPRSTSIAGQIDREPPAPASDLGGRLVQRARRRCHVATRLEENLV